VRGLRARLRDRTGPSDSDRNEPSSKPSHHPIPRVSSSTPDTASGRSARSCGICPTGPATGAAATSAKRPGRRSRPLGNTAKPTSSPTAAARYGRATSGARPPERGPPPRSKRPRATRTSPHPSGRASRSTCDPPSFTSGTSSTKTALGAPGSTSTPTYDTASTPSTASSTPPPRSNNASKPRSQTTRPRHRP